MVLDEGSYDCLAYTSKSKDALKFVILKFLLKFASKFLVFWIFFPFWGRPQIFYNMEEIAYSGFQMMGHVTNLRYLYLKLIRFEVWSHFHYFKNALHRWSCFLKNKCIDLYVNGCTFWWKSRSFFKTLFLNLFWNIFFVRKY